MAYSKKYLNEKHEVIISTEMRPVKQANQDGVIVEHKQIITNIKFYLGYGDTKREINLSKQFIIDLAEQIKELESIREDMIQDENLPF